VKRFQILQNFRWQNGNLFPEVFKICRKLYNLVVSPEAFAWSLLKKKQLNDLLWTWEGIVTVSPVPIEPSPSIEVSPIREPEYISLLSDEDEENEIICISDMMVNEPTDVCESLYIKKSEPAPKGEVNRIVEQRVLQGVFEYYATDDGGKSFTWIPEASILSSEGTISMSFSFPN